MIDWFNCSPQSHFKEWKISPVKQAECILKLTDFLFIFFGLTIIATCLSDPIYDLNILKLEFSFFGSGTFALETNLILSQINSFCFNKSL